MKRIGAIIVILGLLLSADAFAMKKGGYALDINLASHHSKDTYNNGTAYNEDNFGLGASYAWEDWLDLKAGFFDNSYNKTSTYVGAFVHKDFRYGELVLSPGVAGFLMTGYDNTPENAPEVAPIPVFGLGVGYSRVKANLGYNPFGKVDVWMLQMSLELN